MKLKLWSVFAMLCLAMPLLVSCGDDDDKDDLKPEDIQKITGNYNGSLSAVVNGKTYPLDGEYQITILSQKNDNDEVTVILPACTFTMPGTNMTQTIPALTVTDVDVDLVADTYFLEEDDFNMMVDGMAFRGSLMGNINKKASAFTFVIYPGGMPMPITFSFKGKDVISPAN